MTRNFIELKKSVEFLDKKYEDVLSQLRLAKERNMQQSQKLNDLESAPENAVSYTHLTLPTKLEV